MQKILSFLKNTLGVSFKGLDGGQVAVRRGLEQAVVVRDARVAHEPASEQDKMPNATRIRH